MTEGRLRVILAGTLYPQPEGLRLFLEESGYEVLGEVASAEELLDAIRRAEPDVAVVGPELIDPDGIRALKDLAPGMGIVAVTREPLAKRVRTLIDGRIAAGSPLGAFSVELGRVAVASSETGPTAYRRWFARIRAPASGGAGPIAATVAVLTGAWILFATVPNGARPPLADVEPSRPPQVSPLPSTPAPLASPLADALGSLDRLVDAIADGDFERAIDEAQELVRHRELAIGVGLGVDAFDEAVAARLRPLARGLPARVAAQLGSVLGDLLPPPAEPPASPPQTPAPTPAQTPPPPPQTPAPTPAQPPPGPTTGPGPPPPEDVVPVDADPPVLRCRGIPSGWSASNVAVECTARDRGSGLAHPGDAAFTLRTDVPKGTEDADARTPSRTVCDREGNCATAGPFDGIKVDKKAPAVSCDRPDTGWHADDVRVGCTASDRGSGLSDGARFTLTTAVPAGSEDANARTGTARVCDRVGNCDTVGPFDGIKVDKKAPSISIRAPVSGAVYLLNERGAASFDCSDGGSGVATCSGPSEVETSSVGNRSFGVTATDFVGNGASARVGYVVTFGVELVDGPSKASKKLEIRLVDVGGANVSASSIAVTAIDIDGVAFDRRLSYNPGHAVYRLTLPRDIEDGAHVLHLVAEGDPLVHSIAFTVG